MNNKFEYLVTGQGYELDDRYKQTLLLHDTFFANNEEDAKNLFNKQFSVTHKIINVYSVKNLKNN
jgi:hypothetical protein